MTFLPGRAVAAAALAFAFAVARPAAAGVEVSLISYLSARPELRDGRAVTAAPLLELVSIDAWGLNAPGIRGARVHVSGWGSLSPLELSQRGAAAGDLDLAFVEGRALEDRLRFVAGRQLVAGGAARFLQLDGVLAEYGVARLLRVTAWGGVPVSARFNVRQGDAAGGGRVAWAPSWDSEVGASYALVLDRGLVARHDAGVDGRWAPWRSAWVAGHALYSLAEARLVEAELGPHWRVWPSLEVALSARRVSPDLLLPRGSILSVFAEPARDELGAIAVWEPRPDVAVTADARVVWLSGAAGSDAGAQVVGRPVPGTVLIGELRWLDAFGDRYVRVRGAASRRVTPALAVGLDADAFWRGRAINGVNHSAVAAATASWTFAPEWLAVAELGAGTTPELAAEARAMVKVAWRWRTGAADRGGP
ncbi:MAG TPA: hypothetical protein VIG99_10940 [Myxococcaceae bacterium]